MDLQLQSVERVRQESYGALQIQVSAPRRARPETSRTRCALRTCAGAGERAQLRNVVEYAGMVEHCDYVVAGDRDD